MISVPSEVRSIEIISHESNGLRIKWLPPNSPNGDIQRYYIQWNENGNIEKTQSVSYEVNQFYFWNVSTSVLHFCIWAENKAFNGSKASLTI